MEMGKEVWARGSGGGGEGFLLAEGGGIKPGCGIESRPRRGIGFWRRKSDEPT